MGGMTEAKEDLWWCRSRLNMRLLWWMSGSNFGLRIQSFFACFFNQRLEHIHLFVTPALAIMVTPRLCGSSGLMDPSTTQHELLDTLGFNHRLCCTDRDTSAWTPSLVCTVETWWHSSALIFYTNPHTKPIDYFFPLQVGSPPSTSLTLILNTPATPPTTTLQCNTTG